MKPKYFEVHFHTWKDVSITVLADDEDEAIDLATNELLIDETENFEVGEVVILDDGDNRV